MLMIDIIVDCFDDILFIDSDMHGDTTFVFYRVLRTVPIPRPLFLPIAMF